MHFSHGWYIHHNYSIYNVLLPNSSGSDLQPPEPEPPSPLYYSHSIMSIRMALHYIITCPCFHYSSENIPYNISHNPHFVLILQTRLVSLRAQSLQLRPNRAAQVSQLEGPASQSRANHADERTNQRPDSGAYVNCLTSSVALFPYIT